MTIEKEEVITLFNKLRACAVGTTLDCGCKHAVSTAIYYEMNDLFWKFILDLESKESEQTDSSK